MASLVLNSFFFYSHSFLNEILVWNQDIQRIMRYLLRKSFSVWRVRVWNFEKSLCVGAYHKFTASSPQSTSKIKFKTIKNRFSSFIKTRFLMTTAKNNNEVDFLFISFLFVCCFLSFYIYWSTKNSFICSFN